MSQADLIIGFTQGYSIQCRLVSGKKLMVTGIVGFNWRRTAEPLSECSRRTGKHLIFQFLASNGLFGAGLLSDCRQPRSKMTREAFVIVRLTRIVLRSTALELLWAIRPLSTQAASSLRATHLKDPRSLHALQAPRSQIELRLQHQESRTYSSQYRETSFRTTNSPVPCLRP
jgi:hypothetical protein